MRVKVSGQCSMCGRVMRILARDCCAACYQKMRRAGLLAQLPENKRGRPRVQPVMAGAVALMKAQPWRGR